MSEHVVRLGRRAMILAAAASPVIAAGAGRAAAATAATDPARITIQRLAWAGIKLEFGDTALFVDAVAPDADNAPGPALATKAARSFALVTHHHGDHCDPAALRPVLGDHGYLTAHEEVARYFDNRIVNVQPTRMHEPVFLPRGSAAFVARCVPASDGLGSPQVSWVIDGGGRRMIHCGDTLWHGGWWDIARAYGPFDLAFLPINGFRQIGGRYLDTGQVMGMTADQAVSAAVVLKAKSVVPIHYGAPRSPDYVEEPDSPARFAKLAAAAGLAVRAAAPGDSFLL